MFSGRHVLQQAPRATFEVTLTSTRDRIYDNEIYAAGSQIKVTLELDIVYRNVNVRSKVEAEQLIQLNWGLAENALEPKVAEYVKQFDFILELFRTGDVENWELLLQEPKTGPGERRSMGVELVEALAFRL